MKYIKKFLIQWASVALLIPAIPVTAETVHIAHCRGACPPAGGPDNEVVVRHLYAASVDSGTGLAQWVAYRVLPGSVGVASLLPRRWEADSLLRSGVPDELLEAEGPRLVQPDLSNVQDREYRVNEVLINPEDRGRLAPMSSFAGTPYWEELNKLSNMAPLPPALRLGSWARLEMAINELSARTGVLYVVTGPLSANPQGYFKVVVSTDGLVAFEFPRDLPLHADFCVQASTLARIEARIGFALFPSAAPGAATTLQEDLGCRH
ncbi:MAG: DNA/RNA non-specific endonuclease [Pseudohongiellaceae bacterium]